jgi:hypothetical protein
MRSGVVLGFRLANLNYEREISQARIINTRREDANKKKRGRRVAFGTVRVRLVLLEVPRARARRRQDVDLSMSRSVVTS